jgi:serine/threonine-protein kinase
MNPDQWATLEPLLDTLLDLPVEERAGWLEALARESPDRAQRLRALLDAETDADRQGFLAAPIHATLAGMQLGPWRLERALGQGGMGTVWLARRADGNYEGEAAVKILNLALLSPSGQERFRREGSVLARLTHPNIARLLDAGVAAAGQPYLVLERVDGVPIDEYAREHDLSRTDRIELFLQVLAAVGHAHAHLVVHRDLKPSNILVTHDGSVKLLDFGIAKLMGDGQTGAHSLVTLEGRHLTPRYAAPEQVRDEPLTTATDVHALGVLLYLLLSGRHPTGEHARTPAEAIRAALDDEPGRLGLGDLDTILAKAMRKKPAERYQSVAALGDDLRRYLREEPVSARPHSLAYRAGKFVRRNKGSVVAAGLVLLTLVAATLITTRQMLDAQRQRDVARIERDNALFQQRQATASSGFMESLLQTIAPTGRAYTIQELLDQARLLLEQDFAQDPRFQARMMNELSDQYFTLHDRQHELPLLTRAEELAVGAGDYALAAYSSCRLGKSAADDGRATLARSNLLRGRRFLARAGAAARDAEVQCLRGESALERLLGHTDVALSRARRAVALGALAGDTLSFSHLSAINELARALHDDDQIRPSLEVTREMLGLLARTGRSHTLTALVEQYNEGALLARLGEPRAADSTLHVAEQLSEGMGPENRHPLYMTLLDGELAVDLGRPAVAMQALRGALAESERREDQPYQQRALEDLTRLALAEGSLTEADRYFTRLQRLAPDSTNWHTALLGARLQFAHGDQAHALKRYMAVLVERGFPEKGRSTSYFARLVLEAARMALASGDLAAADSLTAHTLRIARNEGHVDSLSTVIRGAVEVREAVERERGA